MGESAGTDAVQQRFAALKTANRVRLARAKLKRLIGGGEVTAAEVVRECPWEAEGMTVVEILVSQKRWGGTRCRRVLTPIGIPENKTIGGLTERQRVALLETLGGPEPDESRAAEPESRHGGPGGPGGPSCPGGRNGGHVTRKHAVPAI